MKLSRLAQESGVSTASIKYYIHAGILPPGRKKNATTAVYDSSHLDRLALITWLRQELGTSIDGIRTLTRAIDDENVEDIALMGRCQDLALSATAALPGLRTGCDSPMGDEDGSGPGTGSPARTTADSPTSTDARPETAASPRRDFDDDVRTALARLDLPDVSVTARRSVAAVLDGLSRAGYPVGVDTVVRHVEALTEIASRNTRPLGTGLSRDRICLEVIRGITMHNRLLVATSALVHASLSALARNSLD